MKMHEIKVLVNGALHETVSRTIVNGSVCYKGIWHDVTDGAIDGTAEQLKEKEIEEQRERRRMEARNPKWMQEHQYDHKTRMHVCHDEPAVAELVASSPVAEQVKKVPQMFNRSAGLLAGMAALIVLSEGELDNVLKH